MTNDILLCEYSYHNHKKYFNWKSGLDYYFIRLQTEGECRAQINEEIYHLSTGDLILSKPEDRCELFIEEYTDSSGGSVISSGDFYIMCKGPWMEQWWNRKKRNTLSRVYDDRHIIVLWKEIILEKRQIYEKDEELLDYLLKALCLSIDNALKNSDHFRHPVSQSAYAMKSYIEEHAAQPLKVEDVAKHVGFSNSRASHLFKDYFGKTIIDYALELRLNTAMRLIKNSEMSLEQIADMSGFRSYTYFYRVFRKNVGMTPTQYRTEGID